MLALDDCEFASYQDCRPCFDLSDNDDHELRVHGPMVVVLTKTGAPAEVWDLHVGATLNVMGRTITLLKADGETSLWIERHSR